jgi:hypothetical protein
MIMIDKQAIQAGDSIQWANRKGGTSWGLAEYVTADRMHVKIRIDRDYRYAIPWKRVLQHVPGREMYDKAMR